MKMSARACSEWSFSQGAGIVASALLTSSPANAADSWLDLLPSESCSPARDVLMSHVHQMVAGLRSSDLAAEVRFSDLEAATAARILLSSNGRVVGIRVLEAPTCEETTQAVTVVLALALSSTASASNTGTPGAELAPHATLEQHTGEALQPRGQGERRQTGFEAETKEPAQPEDVASLPGHSKRDFYRHSGRWLLGFAAEQGTFAHPTGLVGLGVNAVFEHTELRAAVWYAPTWQQEESQRDGSLRRESSDSASATLDYCYGFGEQHWAMGCTGLDFAVARSSLLVENAAERLSGDSLTPSLRSTLGAVFAYRAGLVQPELLFSAGYLTAGGTEEAQLWALRTGLGAAVSF